MHLPQFTPDQDAGAPDPFDEAEAQRRAIEIVESAVENPTEGSALLRASALLMAYLAAHEPDPDKAAAVLIAEQSANLHTCLHRMASAIAGTA